MCFSQSAPWNHSIVMENVDAWKHFSKFRSQLVIVCIHTHNLWIYIVYWVLCDLYIMRTLWPVCHEDIMKCISHEPCDLKVMCHWDLYVMWTLWSLSQEDIITCKLNALCPVCHGDFLTCVSWGLCDLNAMMNVKPVCHERFVTYSPWDRFVSYLLWPDWEHVTCLYWRNCPHWWRYKDLSVLENLLHVVMRSL